MSSAPSSVGSGRRPPRAGGSSVFAESEPIFGTIPLVLLCPTTSTLYHSLRTTMSTSHPHINPLAEPFKVEAETIHTAPDPSSLPVSSSSASSAPTTDHHAPPSPSPSRPSTPSRPSPIGHATPHTSGRPSISTTHVDSSDEVDDVVEHGEDGGKKVKKVKLKGQKKEVVLQDQTNLLPVRQVSPSARLGRCDASAGGSLGCKGVEVGKGKETCRARGREVGQR